MPNSEAPNRRPDVSEMWKCLFGPGTTYIIFGDEERVAEKK